MNAKIEPMTKPVSHTAPVDWRPPGWIEAPPDADEPYTPINIEKLFKQFSDEGYYTRGGKLRPDLEDDPFADEATRVAHNRRCLRDAWNTNGIAWRLAAALVGRDFVVDPFWNAGAQNLPALVVRLDGQTPIADGMLTVKEATRLLADDKSLAPVVRDMLTVRVAALGSGVSEDFPVNWRQHLARGEAPAAANGPHSCTEKWLRCCAAYGAEEFVAAFVPDNGDGWFQSIAMTAALVVRLGRVHCSPPPGVEASSPRGASALCVWVPPSVRDEARKLHERAAAATKPSTRAKVLQQADALLPEITRRVLFDGAALAVPAWARVRSDTQHAIVQRGDLLTSPESIIDLGLV